MIGYKPQLCAESDSSSTMIGQIGVKFLERMFAPLILRPLAVFYQWTRIPNQGGHFNLTWLALRYSGSWARLIVLGRVGTTS